MNGAAVRSWEGKIETQSAETRSGPDNQEGFSETFNFLQPGGSFVFEEIDKRIIEVVERLSGGQFAGGIAVIVDDNCDFRIEESEGLIRRVEPTHVTLIFSFCCEVLKGGD